MYKKAGIIIALVLIAGAFLMLGIFSCTQGGVKIQENGGAVNSGTNGTQASVGVQETSADVSVVEVESVGTVEPSANSGDGRRSSYDTSVTVGELRGTERSDRSEVSDTQRSRVYVDENGNPITAEGIKAEASERAEGSNNDSSESDGNSFYLIDPASIKYDFTDKVMNGKVVEHKMLYSDSALYTALDVLAEDGNVYTYFVPFSAYEGCRVGDNAVITVRIYYATDISISEVLSLKVDSGGIEESSQTRRS